VKGRFAVRAAVALLGAVAVVAVFSAEEDRSLSATSFGNVPRGFGAVYELLSGLGLAVDRSYARSARLPAGATVWWIAPRDLCAKPRAGGKDEVEATEGEGMPAQRLTTPCLDATPFLAVGGTAVVFLDDAAAECGTTIGSIAVPAREGGAREPVENRTISGELARDPYLLEVPPLASFAELEPGWTVAAAVEGKPFVVERAVESGRLVLVADAAFLTNQWLGDGDAAPLAVDLVRRFGVPRFDERSHRLGPPRNATRLLARSPALPFLFGLAVLAVGFAWMGAAVPERRLADSPTPRPTLGAFVDSMARLFSETRDRARTLACYREATAARIRRRFRLPAETPLEALVQRLARRGDCDPNALGLLAGGGVPRSAAGLREAFAALDGLADSSAGRDSLEVMS
jgi:hypothetical protein